MSNNDSWTPEEIARANERQKEISEVAERKKALLELKKSKETPQANSHIMLKMFLMPVTILYFLGVVFGFVAILAATSQSLNQTLGALGFTAMLAIAGCGIGSIWWLLTNYEKLSFPNIPIRIWIGLGIGVFISVAAVMDFYTAKPLTAERAWFSLNETGIWIVYGSPVFVLLYLLVGIAHNGK